MTLEEARVAWLTIIGSRWVDMVDVFDSDDPCVWKAYSVLRFNDSLEADPYKDTVKLKCKS